jgi:hypothetical protein
MQETFRFFILNGLTAPGTVLNIDNIVVYEPIVPATEPEPEPVINYWPIENGIQKGDFELDGMVIDGTATNAWSKWTTVDQGRASVQIDANMTIVEGKAVVEILGTGGEVWYIQLGYRPNDPLLNVVPGKHYKVEFDVNATVAGTFSMEMTTTDNAANVAIPVTLEVGDNHVVVEYVAYEENLKLTACLGLYGLATLTFDNFEISEEVELGYVEIENGIQNGDFELAEMVIDGTSTKAWMKWTTVDQGWASTQIDANMTVVEGKAVVEILGTGGEVWYIQFGYRPNDPLLNVVPGNLYRVEFDVHATVAGTFSMEMTTTDNAANVAIPVTLEVGDNHVVVDYVAYEENFKLTACLGLYGLATLTFDNFTISDAVPFEYSAIAGGIQNGDFELAEMVIDGTATNAWSKWTTVDQGWASVQIDANMTVVEGKAVIEILGTGGDVWYIQLDTVE